MSTVYKRILLKLSGEVLAGSKSSGIDNDTVVKICKSVKKVADHLAKQVKELLAVGHEVGIVVGGGNFWRGRSSEGMDRARADHIGMLATAMNALALCDALEQLGADVRVQTAIEMRQIAEPYIRSRAIRHLEKGRIVIFGCGTGSPFFSTDTAAALRSVEMNADALLKATNVDGVFDKDPNKYSDAVKYDRVTFKEVINRDLKVMDSTAFSLCKDNDMSIIVFNLDDPDNIISVVNGENIGTTVEN